MIRPLVVTGLALLLSGCQTLPWTQKRMDPIGPPLPWSISCHELVQTLNEQSGDLTAWQSTDLELEARMPPSPFPVRLKGNISCQSPNRFRLIASKGFMLADLGANEERCWILLKPSPGGHDVISWHHEDAHLLQQHPAEVPYINPDWLMLVLGVKRLDPAEYTLEPRRSTDQDTGELWLTSVRKDPSGGNVRYVIKVDPQRRVAREHVAWNGDGAAIVRAQLSEHQWVDGHLIPQRVQLDFPTSGAQLVLSVKNVRANPSISSSHWKVPSTPHGNDVDLGRLIASRMYSRQKEREIQQMGGSRTVGLPGRFRYVPSRPDATDTEPQWVDGGEPQWSDPNATPPDWCQNEPPPAWDNGAAAASRRPWWKPRWWWK